MERLSLSVASSLAALFLAICLASGNAWSQFDDAGYDATASSADGTIHEILTGTADEDFSSALGDVNHGNSLHGVGCYACCPPCCGPFSVRIGPTLMKRERLDDVPILTDNFGAGPTALAASTFGFDYEGGLNARLRYDRCDWPVTFEAGYQWTNNWTSTAAGSVTNAVINTNPQTFTFGTAFSAADYRSEFQAFELNVRRECSQRVSLLAGFRYVDFAERLDLDVGGARNYWMTGNSLLGFQLGGDVTLYEHCCRWRIDGFGRAGVYGNDADTAVRIDVVEVGPVSQSDGMDHVAFLGEVGLTASYQISACWSVRAGYQVSWLEGMLVAGNQVPLTTNTAVVQGFDYSGVLFHGVTLLAEARW